MITEYCVQEFDPPFGRPHWQHDCDQCQYLGTISLLGPCNLEDELADFYRCPKGVLGMSYLCRTGHEPGNYSSLPERVLADMVMPEGDPVAERLWMIHDFYCLEPRDEKLGIAVLFGSVGTALLVRAHPLLSPRRNSYVEHGIFETLRDLQYRPAQRVLLDVALDRLRCFMLAEIDKEPEQIAEANRRRIENLRYYEKQVPQNAADVVRFIIDADEVARGERGAPELVILEGISGPIFSFRAGRGCEPVEFEVTIRRKS